MMPIGRRSLAALTVIWTLLATGAAVFLSGGRHDLGGAMAQPATSPTYVGAETCGACHTEQQADWQGSHHDLAMQHATDETVLGDFDDATLTHFDVTSTFFRRDGKFVVRTEGANGALEDVEVAFTFGVEPLQQYLVAFQGGRYQALRLAWDTRPAEDGGQRWLHLDEDERVLPGDPFHWTGQNQNWNFMCSDCHSTDVVRNYDFDTDTYDTTFAEVDVACEACHGPGSTHVTWAESGGPADAATKGLVVAFDPPPVWEMNPDTGIAVRVGPSAAATETNVCARCHSRRSAITDGHTPGQPFLDSYLLSLLRSDLYHADGQILDEVFVHGSFLQSKMYAAGVTCTGCHNPHSLALRADGNGVCAQCHEPAKFDTADHHFHPAGSTGARCASCHMPAQTYLVVDDRRDHSFRVPRPDLSITIGAPNACTQCHGDQSDEWALAAVEDWYGPDRRNEPHFGLALHAARDGLPGAEGALRDLIMDDAQPAIARATALSLLSGDLTSATRQAVVAAAADSNPVVRLGAVRSLQARPLDERTDVAAPLLDDPLLALRIEAASAMAAVPPEQLSASQQTSRQIADDEFVAAQLAIAERSSAHFNLGNFHGDQGQFATAERAYQTALTLDPSFTPAAINLAGLYRARGVDDAGEAVLRQAAAENPTSGEVQHALGLLLVRQSRVPDAVQPLARAAELNPENPRYGLVYGLALESAGDPAGAIAALAATNRRHPADRDVLESLVRLTSDAGELEQALIYAQRLQELDPRDRTARDLVRALETMLRRRR